MDDRTLLEKAAKAAGIQPATYERRKVGWHIPDEGVIREWNPLKDDGDVARLEARLLINVIWHQYWVEAQAPTENGRSYFTEHFVDFGGDKLKARRHASVKAAAAAMEGV